MGTVPILGSHKCEVLIVVLVLAEIKSMARTCEDAMMALCRYLEGNIKVECLGEPVFASFSCFLFLRLLWSGLVRWKQHVPILVMVASCLSSELVIRGSVFLALVTQSSSVLCSLSFLLLRRKVITNCLLDSLVILKSCRPIVKGMMLKITFGEPELRR